MTDPNVWARHKESHGTVETYGSYCHNCRFLSCIPQRKRTEPYRYFCEVSHKHLGIDGVKDMDEGSCPSPNDGRRSDGALR